MRFKFSVYETYNNKMNIFIALMVAYFWEVNKFYFLKIYVAEMLCHELFQPLVNRSHQRNNLSSLFPFLLIALSFVHEHLQIQDFLKFRLIQ